jgi:2-polyprenyl-6-methoxyphenol hydroxylase-like FAD-dependent oxidoreductase
MSPGGEAFSGADRGVWPGADRGVWEVAVLGGGPAGCATALALRRRGLERVCLVEAGDGRAVRIGESIPPDTRAILDGELGLWPDFLAEGHEPCHGSCSVWGSATPGYNDFLLNPQGHGWHLDRRRFDAFLGRMAAARGVALATGWRFVAAEPLAGGGFRLALAGGEGRADSLAARFVVDATGSAAAFARERGGRRRRLDQLVFAAGFLNLAADSPLPRLTLLEATEAGWWYAARLPGGRAVVALAGDADLLRGAGHDQARGWLEQVRTTRLVAASLGAASLEPARLDGGSVGLWPAVSFLREGLAGPDWLAVGDAASGYDPLSSQGIQKAFTDALAAAAVIAARLGASSSGGGADTPAGYAAGVQERFEDYLANRGYFYQQENRWPDAPFWQRRRQRSVLRD